jgi:NAD(P)-dependent dehydrogenase (short-subunit alcohol dehydrogenase family)
MKLTRGMTELVTGASSRIGAAIAHRLALSGVDGNQRGQIYLSTHAQAILRGFTRYVPAPEQESGE